MADPGAIGGKYLMASCSSCALARLGLICQSATPPYQTCHRRFRHWVRSRVIRGVLEQLAEDIRNRGGFCLEEDFIDGSFALAKKGGKGVGKTKRGKGTKIMAVFAEAFCPG